MQRPVWSSQLAYILTVAGATIGFGFYVKANRLIAIINVE